MILSDKHVHEVHKTRACFCFRNKTDSLDWKVVRCFLAWHLHASRQNRSTRMYGQVDSVQQSSVFMLSWRWKRHLNIRRIVVLSLLLTASLRPLISWSWKAFTHSDKDTWNEQHNCEKISFAPVQEVSMAGDSLHQSDLTWRLNQDARADARVPTPQRAHQDRLDCECAFAVESNLRVRDQWPYIPVRMSQESTGHISNLLQWSHVSLTETADCQEPLHGQTSMKDVSRMPRLFSALQRYFLQHCQTSM